MTSGLYRVAALTAPPLLVRVLSFELKVVTVVPAPVFGVLEDAADPVSSCACDEMGKSLEVPDTSVEDTSSDGVRVAWVEDESAAVSRDERLGVREVKPLRGNAVRQLIMIRRITTYKGFRTGTMARSPLS